MIGSTQRLGRLSANVVIALVVLASVSVAWTSEPTHYRIVTARKLDNLENGLQESAAAGYRLIGSGAGIPFTRQRAMIHLLLESLPEGANPPRYLVIGKGWHLPAGDLDIMQEKGAQGFGVRHHGVIDRPRQTPLWAPLPHGTGMQSVIIMEMMDPAMRWEYAVERFPRAPGEWPSLASKFAEGYRVVAVTQMAGAILARREGDQPVDNVEQDRFKVISSLRKKKLAVKLDAAAKEDFRLVAAVFGKIKGGSYDLLLERTDPPGQAYEYRLLPWRKDSSTLMNEYGAQGFRVHPAAWWIMERGPTANIAYEYRILEAESTDALAKVMDGAAADGYRFVRFFFAPCRLLVERSKPGG